MVIYFKQNWMLHVIADWSVVDWIGLDWIGVK